MVRLPCVFDFQLSNEHACRDFGMSSHNVFSSTYKRKVGSDQTMEYWFSNLYTQDEITRNEKPPLGINGEIIYSEDSDIQRASDEQCFGTLPEEVQNPECWKQVLTQWIQDCSGAFQKPPTIERCLANCSMQWDNHAPIATISQSEEESDWILQWIPTSVRVYQSKFTVFWAPCYKILYTRIPETIVLSDETESVCAPKDSYDIEVQQPERVYTFVPKNTRHDSSESGFNLEECTDIPTSYMDVPALRLETEQDEHLSKYRRKVREARLRAKLAHYRAERIAQRFEQRFGYYPEEEGEEVLTEAEQTDDE
jgi:hypothetical protein